MHVCVCKYYYYGLQQVIIISGRYSRFHLCFANNSSLSSLFLTFNCFAIVGYSKSASSLSLNVFLIKFSYTYTSIQPVFPCWIAKSDWRRITHTSKQDQWLFCLWQLASRWRWQSNVKWMEIQIKQHDTVFHFFRARMNNSMQQSDYIVN